MSETIKQETQSLLDTITENLSVIENLEPEYLQCIKAFTDRVIHDIKKSIPIQE